MVDWGTFRFGASFVGQIGNLPALVGKLANCPTIPQMGLTGLTLRLRQPQHFGGPPVRNLLQHEGLDHELVGVRELGHNASSTPVCSVRVIHPGSSSPTASMGTRWCLSQAQEPAHDDVQEAHIPVVLLAAGVLHRTRGSLPGVEDALPAQFAVRWPVKLVPS